MVMNIERFGFHIEQHRCENPKGFVAIATGHSQKDPGANGKYVGIPEFEFALEADRRFASLLCQKGYNVDHYVRFTAGWDGWKPMIKGELNRRHKKVAKYDLFIMDHYNDFTNEKIEGGMVCHWFMSRKGKKAAGIFQKHLNAHFGIKSIANLSLKPLQRANHMVRIPHPVAIILEKGFGSNPHDGAALLNGRDGYHVAMVEATLEYLSL